MDGPVMSLSGIWLSNPHEADGPEPEECPRCETFGSEPGTTEPCVACLGDGWV